jgi:arylsulfatase A-like enzyme
MIEMANTSAVNVIIVTIDALRKRSLGCYGYEYDISSNIDRLAANGVRFKQAYSCANSTYPSVTTLHSGVHPTNVVINHGGRVTHKEKQRAESLRTIPSALADRDGYYSAWVGGVFGLWHKRGFDYFPPLRPSHDKRVLFEEDYTRSKIRSLLERINGTVADVVSDTYYQFEQTVGRAKEQIREVEDDTDGDEIETILSKFDMARSNDEQFYGYVHLNETHTPYNADKDLIEQYLAEHDYPNEPMDNVTNPEPSNHSAVATAPYTDGWFDERDYEVGVARWLARYDACVKEADNKIGRLIEALESRNAFDDTLFILLSDHGESLTENGIYFSHDGLYEPVTEVPFIVRTPSNITGTVDEFIQIFDIAPTVADVFNLPNDEFDFHGESLIPYLSGTGATPDREAVITEMASSQRRRAVRKGKYKYIYRPENPLGNLHDNDTTCRKCGHDHWIVEELYDLSADPGETENIVGKEPEVATELRETAAELEASYQIEDVDTSKTINYEEEDAIEERLKHLGYK